MIFYLIENLVGNLVLIYYQKVMQSTKIEV